MTKESAAAIGMFSVAAVGIWSYTSGGSTPTTTSTSVPSPPTRPEDPHAKFLRTVRGESKYAAQEIIKKRLKAPSQAEFVESEVLETSGSYALVFLRVDAPNNFGVKLRAGYCVVLSFREPAGDHYEWNDLTGAIRCDERPDEASTYALKVANGWPDPGAAPATFTAGAETRRKHHR